MIVVGKRTSIYLSDGLAAAVEASGVPLAELVRRGLGVGVLRPPRALDGGRPVMPRAPERR